MSYKKATREDIDAAIKRAVAPELERMERLAAEIESRFTQYRVDHGKCMNLMRNVVQGADADRKRMTQVRESVLRAIADSEKRRDK